MKYLLEFILTIILLTFITIIILLKLKTETTLNIIGIFTAILTFIYFTIKYLFKNKEINDKPLMLYDTTEVITL
jgi:hypothetical protein